MAEWQTHKTQNLAGVTSCGFKSHQPHKSVKLSESGFTLFVILYSLYFEADGEDKISWQQNRRDG